ncbi:MAG TPA: sulfate ABC transporter permease subunit [Nocardioides sp.]|nr:sulfate ABC transporter permease subunit [Nocardioides sp.]
MVELGGPLKWGLRILVLGYVGLLVAWPTTALVRQAFAGGVGPVVDLFGRADVQHALVLSCQIAIQAVVVNLVFGVTISLLLVRYEFPGKRVLSALIDLPMAVSPVVVGLSLLLVYGPRNGWFGPTLESWGVHIIFSGPGMVMATAFVALPLVVREVVPVLTEIGDDQEQAARSLGANFRQTFWRITLPSIKWAVVYGVVLSLARCLGEFGAVKVVSGNVINQTQTATLLVESQYHAFEQDSAYAISFVLAFISVVCIVVVSLLRPKEHS